MYRQMATIRAFDNRAVEEFHAGNIPGVVHAYLGQEAIAVGVCTALRRDDKIVSTHRGHGHTIAKGADLTLMMAELGRGRMLKYPETSVSDPPGRMSAARATRHALRC